MDEHPTVSWQAMQDGNVFYRRQHLYDVSGKLPNLNEHVIAGCRYGGPIGASDTLRDSLLCRIIELDIV